MRESFTYKPYATLPTRTRANIRQSRIDVMNPKMEEYYKDRELHSKLIQENRKVLVEKTCELLQVSWQNVDWPRPLHIVLEGDFKSTLVGLQKRGGVWKNSVRTSGRLHSRPALGMDGSE